jgi:hypothetical protein
MKFKKADSDTIFNWTLYRIPIIIIVVVFFFIVLKSHYNSGLKTHEVENLILIKRLTYSPNILAYRDSELNRVYPGVIDIEKFDTEKIEENLINKNNRLAVYMELENLKTTEIRKAYINEERARAWDDYVYIGGFDSSTLKRYVKIYDNEEIYPGILKLKVLVRK